MPLATGVRQQVIDIKTKYPCYRQVTIAQQVGVSRQRVSSILTDVGMQKRHIRKRICLNCGNVIENNNKKFCNNDCSKAYHTLKLTCEECGTEFPRRTSEVLSYDDHHKRGHYFCSKKCFGKWCGTNYGFGSKYEKGEIIHENKDTVS